MQKILIEFRAVNDYPFKQYLAQWEYPTGSTINFLFTITNIGDSNFSGTVEEQRTRYSSGVATKAKFDITIDSLKPKEKRDILQVEVAMLSEGHAWHYVKLEASNEEQVEFYQREDGLPATGEWSNTFMVISKEQLKIIDLLTEVRKQLDKLTK